MILYKKLKNILKTLRIRNSVAGKNQFIINVTPKISRDVLSINVSKNNTLVFRRKSNCFGNSHNHSHNSRIATNNKLIVKNNKLNKE
jgi:hypothetical protein